jgi:hypothetical protein
MPVDPVGLVLGIAGLLAAFKGAVDGYVLIDAIIEKDNGSRYLALRYYVEKHKLKVWGDYFSVEDAAKCTLNNESENTRKLIATILAEISATHETASKYLYRFDLSEPEDLPRPSAGILHIGSTLIESMKLKRQKQKSKKNLRWGGRTRHIRQEASPHNLERTEYLLSSDIERP